MLIRATAVVLTYLLSAEPSAKAAEDDELLSREWAVKTRQEAKICPAPKGGGVDTFPDEAEDAAREWSGYGRGALEEGDASRAVLFYETAIRCLPSGALYRSYGEALLRSKACARAEKVFALGLALEPSNPEMLHYGRARALAACNDLSAAQQALAQAVKEGFRAFQAMDTDPDLASLRAKPDWADKRSALLAAVNPPQRLAGTLDIPGLRMSHSIYHLCRNGTVVSSIWCGGYHIGNWSSRKGSLSYEMLRRCEKIGIRCEKDREDHFGLSLSRECPKCESYRIECGAVVNPIVQTFTRQQVDNIVAGREMSYYSAGRPVRKPDGGSGEPHRGAPIAPITLKAFSGDEPRQCAPGFVPRTLDDLNVP